VNFLDLPLKSRRAAFAKMDAADKAKAPKKPAKKGASRKIGSGATAKKAAAKRGTTGQVPLSSVKSGKYSQAEIDTLVANYRVMHGKAPSPAQLAKLTRKRR
jgi:hypothetical protein